MRLGSNQLQVLVALGSPTMTLLVPGPECASMVKGGLLRRHRGTDGAVCITAAGLRKLADEMDAGRVTDALTRMEAEVAARSRNTDFGTKSTV